MNVGELIMNHYIEYYSYPIPVVVTGTDEEVFGNCITTPINVWFVPADIATMAKEFN